MIKKFNSTNKINDVVTCLKWLDLINLLIELVFL